MKLILHIGPPKSGTSHLQSSFHEDYDNMLKQGILYPKAGRQFEKRLADRHVGLRFAAEAPDVEPSGMMKHYSLEGSAARQKYAAKFWRDLEQEMKQARHADTVIFSDEALFVFANETMITNLSNHLSQMFDSVTIVAFLRKPSQFMISSYSQLVKMGGKKRWEGYVDNRVSNPKANSLYLNNLMKWKKCCRHDDFFVRPLSKDVFDDFRAVSGLVSMPAPSQKNSNNALSYVGISVLRRINEISGIAENRPAKIRRLFEKFATGSKWKPCAADIQSIDDAYKEEIVSIWNTFNVEPEGEKVLDQWFQSAEAPANQPVNVMNDTDIDEMAKIIIGLAKGP